MLIDGPPMERSYRSALTLSFALALAGCADNTTRDPGGDPDPNPEPPRALEVSGSYRVHSTFDLAASLPDQGFVTALIAATDDPDDPMLWVVDQMLAAMDPGALRSLLDSAKPIVASYLNERLTTLAPELVAKLDAVGDRMGAMMKRFGLNEKLTIGSSDSRLVGEIIVDGVRFDVDGHPVDTFLAEHDLDNVIVHGVSVAFQAEQTLALAEHSITLPYGKLVRIGLDIAVIPAIDPTASSLTDLLDHSVDCAAVGASVADALGVGSAAIWQSACRAGLARAADLLYSQISSDDPLEVARTGSSRVIDANDDYLVDQLTSGVWSGTLHYHGANHAVVQPASYEGQRF